MKDTVWHMPKNIIHPQMLNYLRTCPLLKNSILNHKRIHNCILPEGSCITPSWLSSQPDTDLFCCLIPAEHELPDNAYERVLTVLVCTKQFLTQPDICDYLRVEMDDVGQDKKNRALVFMCLVQEKSGVLFIDGRAVAPKLQQKKIMTWLSFNIFSALYSQLGDFILESEPAHIATYRFFNPHLSPRHYPIYDNAGRLDTPLPQSVRLSHLLQALRQKLIVTSARPNDSNNIFSKKPEENEKNEEEKTRTSNHPGMLK